MLTDNLLLHYIIKLKILNNNIIYINIMYVYKINEFVYSTYLKIPIMRNIIIEQ